MTRPDRRWFVREAGGEWFLDRGTLLMLVPSLVLASALVAPSVSAPVLVRLLVAGAFGIVVAAVPIELARVGPFRDRAERPVPLLVVVAFSASVGVVKASGTAWAAAMLGVVASTTSELALRATGAATTAAIVLPAVALLRAALERLRAERDVLVAEQLHRLLDGGPVEPSAVDAELAAIVRTAAADLAEIAPGTAQAALTALLEERVRPLVAQLAADGGDAAPRVGRLRDRVAAGRSDLPLRRVVRSALHRPLPVLPTAAGVLLANLGRHVATAGPAAASRIAVGAALGAATGLALPRLLGDRGRGPLGATLGIALASVLYVVGAGLGAGLGAGAGLSPGAVTLAELVVAATLTGHLAIGSAVITSIRHDREEVRRELLRLLGPDGLRAAVDRARDRLRRRELAEHLHADLQNRLLASLHRVERLAGDEAAVLAELAEVQRHLGLAGRLPGDPAGGPADRAPASSSSEPLADRLQTLADRWDGFLDVTLDVRGESEVPAALADRVVRVVAEAITNAVRHGHAGAVRLEVRVGADGVHVIAVDDGTGPRSGPPGGGSAYLDVVARRSQGSTGSTGSRGSRGWSLTADADGGSRLEVLVG